LTEKNPSEANVQPQLNRVLGAWSAAAIVVGTVIGSGIFLVPKTMILAVGTPGMLFVVWVVAGLMSIGGALTYAEMAAAMPEAGGEYVYLTEAYGSFWGFLYAWTQTGVAKSGSIATLATGFFYYLANFVPGLDSKLFQIPLPLGDGGGPLVVSYGQVLAMAVILSLGAVNYFGVRAGGNLQVFVTAIKVLLIAAIVAVGLTWANASAANFHSSVPAPGGFAGFFAALVAALWAYDGWNNLSMVSGEIRNPQRNLPVALVFGTLGVMAIYILANVAYFAVLDAGAVASSDRVAAVMMRRVFESKGAAAVSLAAMISIFAALNGSILSGSRVPYAAARDGLFFKRFRNVSQRHRTPGFSIVALCVWSAVLVLSGRYDQLLTLVIFPSWILYGMAAAAVIVLRRKRPGMERPYRVVGYPWIPLIFIAAASCLVVSTLINSPRESMMGLVIMATGIPFYLYWEKRRGRNREGGSPQESGRQ
jgi:basic amino acid/polyamine antiporter, APA family